MDQDKGTPTPKKEKGKSLGQRWAALQPTKTVLVWACIITAIVTMIIGFTWGGWVTGGTADTMAEDQTEEAIVDRLAPICVAQFLKDPAKAEKLEELKELSSYARRNYVEEQGWATITGKEEPNRDVAAECAKLLMEIPKIVSTPTAETTPPPAEEEGEN